MLATLPRLASGLAVSRSGLRPGRVVQRVMAFKTGEERGKTDIAKAEPKAKAVQGARKSEAQLQHPMRRLSDAMTEMNREMERMMSAFGMEPLLSMSPAWPLMDRMGPMSLMGGATSEPPVMGRLVPLHVEEGDNAYTIHAEVPGFKKEDIKIIFDPDNHVVTMRGEKKEEEKGGEGEGASTFSRNMAFQRSFQLPQDAAMDGSGWKAVTEHGVLTLTVPKAEKPQPKQIEIKVE